MQQQMIATLSTTNSRRLFRQTVALVAKNGVIRKIIGDDNPPTIRKAVLHLISLECWSHSTTRNSSRVVHQKEYRGIPKASGSVGMRRVAIPRSTPPLSQVGETETAMHTLIMNIQVNMVLISG